MKIRITQAIQQEVEGAIGDALGNQSRGKPDPSDGVYLKINEAMKQKPSGVVVIDADERDLAELKSRAEYEVGPSGVCDENIGQSYRFEDRAYWLGRKRAYKALLKQVKLPSA